MASQNVNPKAEFIKHRKLRLLNIPPSTEGEVQDFLENIKARKVVISDSLDSALITLQNGNQLEEAIEKLNNKKLKDNTVTVKEGFSTQLMCIAHLPVTYTDSQFSELCQKYGPVEYSYIMVTEGTGISKGYGLVEFSADLEQVKEIKSKVDWLEVSGQTLHADFVEESHQTWEGLQSKCLLINNMPENFVDVNKLREIYGSITSPVYCQIVTKGEKSLGFGIVEFHAPEDAEKTLVNVRNVKIEGEDVVVTFAIPGKSAVVINNRIISKYGDKAQKPASSLLPDPVSAKPVIAGNPIVMSLARLNPRLMDSFTKVLGELQQAYVSQMMSPVNKPGILGPAPSLPLSPMMNPNMQLGLLVMLALHIQAARREQFTGVLARQLNILMEPEGNERLLPKPSILGDPLTGQANVILTSLRQQLNQVPVLGEDGKPLREPLMLDEKLKFIVTKFVANGRYLNLSLLNNLGQLLVTMKSSDLQAPNLVVKGQSLLGPVPGSTPQPLLNPALGGGKGTSLLGEPPSIGLQSPMNTNAANASINSSLMKAMGLNVGSGSSMGNMGQNLLTQISQGLVHQIGQNILHQMNAQPGSGKGLLGDIPSDGSKLKASSKGNKSLLGEPPLHLKSVKGSGATPPLDQGNWKSAETRKRTDLNYDNKSQLDRWGTGAYESGYNNKGNLAGGYTDYGYESYGDMSGAGGQFSGYGDANADYYNYQSQYGYSSGQADNLYQTEAYSSQFGSGYGGGAGLGSGGGGYGMGGNQASGVNFQDGQTFGKGGSGGLGQDSGKYSNDGYRSGMSAAGYEGGGGMSAAGYEGGGKDDFGNGYESYDMSARYSTGMADGMGGSYTGGDGLLGSGGSGIMGGGGMMGNGLLGSGNVGAMGSGLLGSGMNSGGMGGGMMGSGGMKSGLFGSESGMNSGLLGSGGGMGSGLLGSAAGGMGSGNINTGLLGSGGMGGGMMGSGLLGSGGGMNNGLLGSGGGSMKGGLLGSGDMGGGHYSGGMGEENYGGGMGGGNYGIGMGGGNYGGGMGGGNYGGGMGGGNYGIGMGGSYSNDNMGSTAGSGMMDNYSTNMGGSSRSGGGAGLLGSGGAGLLGSGAGLLGSGGAGLMGSGGISNYGSGLSSGSGSKMGGIGGGTQGGESAAYFTGMSGGSGAGLLPSPSKFMTPAGQKRSYSELLPKPEPSPENANYIGQHSQGIGGHYMDTYKKSRLF